MRARGTIFCCVCVAGAMLAASASEGAGGAGWSSPEPLLDKDIPVVGPPRIDMGQAGYAVAAWTKGKPTLCFEACRPNPSTAQVAVRNPGGSSFGPARRLAPGDTHGLDFGVAEDEGVAVFVWRTRKVGLQTRTHSPLGGFGPIQTITTRGRGFSFDIAHDGSAAVSWRENGEPVVARRAPGGSFGTPVPVPMDDVDGLSVAADGGVAAVDDDDTADSLEPLSASVLEPGQTSFGPREEIPRLRGLVSWPRLQMADDGTVAVLGDIENRGDFQVRASVRPPMGTFGQAADITGDLSGSFPEVDADASGRIVVIWQRHRRSVVPYATSYSDGSGWAPTVRIADPRAGFSFLDVSPNGQTIVGIEGLDSRRFSDALAVTADETLVFDDPRTIESRSSRDALVQHDVAIADSSEAVAVWADHSFGRRTQIFVSTLDG